MATLTPTGQSVKPDGVTTVSQGIYTYADGSGLGLDTKEVIVVTPIVATLAAAAHRSAITSVDPDPFTTPGANFTAIVTAPHQSTISVLCDWNAGLVTTTATLALAYYDGIQYYITETATPITSGPTATHAYRLRSFTVIPGTWAIVVTAMDAGVSPTLTLRVLVS